MGDVTKSKSNNIISPNGNSLAVFVDGETGVMKVKDVRGNVQNLADYISTNDNSSYLYAITKETQSVAEIPNSSKIFFKTLYLNRNIDLINDDTIVFSQEGIYNFNLCLFSKSNSTTFYVEMLSGEDVISWSQKQYYFVTNPNTFVYNITLSVNKNDVFSFKISSDTSNSELSNDSDSVPSSTLTINKIG